LAFILVDLAIGDCAAAFTELLLLNIIGIGSLGLLSNDAWRLPDSSANLARLERVVPRLS
jgi:hypothetical protein